MGRGSFKRCWIFITSVIYKVIGGRVHLFVDCVIRVTGLIVREERWSMMLWTTTCSSSTSSSIVVRWFVTTYISGVIIGIVVAVMVMAVVLVVWVNRGDTGMSRRSIIMVIATIVYGITVSVTHVMPGSYTMPTTTTITTTSSTVISIITQFVVWKMSFNRSIYRNLE